MTVQSVRENAVLDALARRTRTVREIASALEGHGMSLSPHGVHDLLAGLIQRGLVSQAGSAFRITTAGQASVRRRKAGYTPGRPDLVPASRASRA